MFCCIRLIWLLLPEPPLPLLGGKSLPKGFKSYQKDKLNIKNEDGLGKQLKEDVGGDWKKIYDHGKDINGNDIEIHYFQNRNGQIFNPKIKRINDEPVNRKLK